MRYLSDDTIEAWPGHTQRQDRHYGALLLMSYTRVETSVYL